MNMLVGYEDSDVARRTLDLAEKYAKVFGAKIYVVISMVGGRDVPQEALDHADQTLEGIKKRFDQAGILCETRLLARGLEPGEDLVRFAEEAGIDQILIGIKKKSKVGKLLFGSNAQYIILNAPCPVITVK